MSGQSGYSLVEVLVGGAIAAMLGVLLYSVFASTQDQIRQSSNNFRIVEAADFMHNQYHHLSNSSSYAVLGTEYSSVHALGPVFNLDNINQTQTSDKVLFLTHVVQNATWKGLSVQNNWLYEKSGNIPDDTLGAWTIFKIGAESVWVANSRPFVMLAGRKVSRWEPGYIRLSSDLNDSLFFPGLAIACGFGHL
jgi:type II secretory pathway pseudopilin PulG